MLRNRGQATLRCGTHVIDLSQPIVMGILNVTPDSFYSASRAGASPAMLVDMAGEMLEDGATILDIGGYSTRPGAASITPSEEIDRVQPMLEALQTAFPAAILSLDTFRSEIAEAMMPYGISMINDISGGNWDERLITLAAAHHCAYVVMHVKGDITNMHYSTEYEDIVSDLVKYFVNQIRKLTALGVKDIVIDPGFGFSKNMEQNFEIIRRLDSLRFLDCPVMVGVSRKSTLMKTVQGTADDTLHATTALHMAALENGATILRVHDVKPAMDAIAVFQQLYHTKNP